LVNALNNLASSPKLLGDVETVLHKDYIYLDFDVPMFRKWIKAILEANNLHRVVYLFDEFHPFIEANKEQLKTFEDVTESPGINRFFLVPVTHMEIQAYLAEGSDSAKKANDRFYFRRLQMPNDTAFRLAKHAMVDVKEAVVAILKSKLTDVTLKDADLLSLLSEISSGYSLDENTFLANIRIKIEEFTKNSVVQKIKVAWTQLSGTVSPTEWAINNGIPARYIFSNNPEADDILKAINQPDAFSATKLAVILENLLSVKAASISDCQRALKSDVIPARYIRFEISLASLLEYLCSKFGNQPNNWPTRPNIEDFIKSQYRGAIAPQIKEKINNKSAEDLKRQLLQLTDDNPELGLLFWE
jgi:hypothetical protein